MTQFTGTSGADTLTGGAGDDILEGLGGADRLSGGGGNDILIGNTGDRLIDGGAGTDLARLDLSGVTSSMRYTVGSSTQTLPSSLQIQNIEQVDYVGGGAGDWLTGGALNDTLDGRNGNDWLKGEGGDDRLFGGEGMDILEGGAGNDSLNGQNGYDQLTGGDGNDALYGGSDDVSIDGGAGEDWGYLDFSNTNNISQTFSVADNQAGWVKIGTTAVKGLESVSYTGGSQADTISGGDLDDNLRGGGGDDVLTGDGGDDVLDGGDGEDVAKFSGARADYQATLIDATTVRITDLRTGADGTDSLKNVERFSFSDGTLSFGELIEGTPNRAPTATADSAAANEDAGLVIDVLANDGDPDLGDSIHIASVNTNGLMGGVSINGGKLAYNAGNELQALSEGETKVETFSYTIADEQGATSTAQVSVTVTGMNDAPTLTDDYKILSEDGATVIRLLDNDQDVDHGDTISLASATAGTRGSVQMLGDGTVSYRPGASAQGLNAGETMQDSFTYTVKDSHGATSTATAHVVIQGANDAPTAEHDAVTAARTGPTSFANLLANDRDADTGDTISITSVQGTSASGAHVTLGAGGKVVYDPGQIYQDLGAGQTAHDSFTYTVTDSHGATSIATVDLTITGQALPEDGLIVTAYVAEDQSSDDLYQLIMDQAESVFGDAVTLEGLDLTGTLGSVAQGPGSVIYTADADEQDAYWGDSSGATQFLFTIKTAAGELHTGAVVMNVEGFNDAPVAVDDTATAVAGGGTGQLWTKLLANDIDPDVAQQHEIVAVDTTGTLGRLAYDAEHHSLAYYADTAAFDDLAAGQTITDHFTYTMEDEYGFASQAVVTVTVTGGEGWAFA